MPTGAGTMRVTLAVMVGSARFSTFTLYLSPSWMLTWQLPTGHGEEVAPWIRSAVAEMTTASETVNEVPSMMVVGLPPPVVPVAFNRIWAVVPGSPVISADTEKVTV